MDLTLLKAVENEDMEQVNSLLDSKEPIDQQDKDGRTPLMVAVQKNNLQIAKLLLDRGANPNVRDNTMLSPWLCAGANGFHKMLQTILGYNPEISSTNRFGGTVLLPSSEKGYLKTVEVALEAGVPVNHVNDLGWSALQEAVILGNGGFLYSDIIRKLMLHGANPDLKDNEGKTAKDWAVSRGEHHVVDILEGKLDTNHQDVRKLIEDEKYDEAIKLLGEGDSLQECYLLGYSYTLLEKYEEALKTYRKAAEMDGGSPEFLFYSANVLRTMKRVEEALSEYDKAINANPDYFFYRYHKSNYLRELGKHEEAVVEMDKLLSNDQNRYDYLFHKANSLRSLGRHKEAVEAMDRAIKADPNNPLYVFHKAKSLALMEHYEDSLKLLEEVVKVKPTKVYLDELEAVKRALEK